MPQKQGAPAVLREVQPR